MPPSTPALSPSHSVYSPSSVYDAPITPQDTSPQIAGSQFGANPNEIFQYNGSFRQVTALTRDDFSFRFCNVGKANSSGHAFGNAMVMPDSLHGPSFQLPLFSDNPRRNMQPTGIGNPIGRTIDPIPSFFEAHPSYSLRTSTLLQQSALGPTDFVRDSVYNAAPKSGRGLCTGKSNVLHHSLTHVP